MSESDPPTGHDATPGTLEQVTTALRDVDQVTRTATGFAGDVAQLASARNPTDLAGALGHSAQDAAGQARQAFANDPTARQVADTSAAGAGLVERGAAAARAAQETAGVISRAFRNPAGALAEQFGGGTRLPDVRYAFTSRGLPDAHFRVVHVEAREGLNELFRCVLELATADLDAEADLDALLAHAGVFEITRGDHARRFCGIVANVTYRGVHHGQLRCRVVLVPAFWTLGLNRDSKIYQDRTVPEILRDALTERLLVPRDVRLELTRTYPRREYCVQYRESDLAFALRLMAEEGLAARLDCTGEHEILVVSDDTAAFPALATHDDAAVTLRTGSADTAPEESLHRFGPKRALRTTGAFVRDFDWTRPDMSLERLAGAADVRGLKWTSFEYPAPLTIGRYDDGAHAYQADDRMAQAELRRQAMATGMRPVRGAGVVTGFTPGLTFQLRGHGRTAFNRQYLVTSVKHVGSTPWNDDEARAATASDRPAYENRFTCLPTDVPYRPARPATRPTIAGAQTATVVGPPGEEIHTDHHGRVKVRFHWDREGTTANDTKTCWVRVAQAWAGQGWGTQFIPRIGMEVIVTFLEGDPDRPLILGCVYNGTHALPFATEKYKTQSGIRTRSSLKSEGFNELRFDDEAGGEEIYVHAQKHLREDVEHNHTTHVKGNQSNTVDCCHDETVGAVQRLTVKHHRIKTVHRNETTTVHGNRTENVLLDENIGIVGNRIKSVHGDEVATILRSQYVTVGMEPDNAPMAPGERWVRIANKDGLQVDGDKSDFIRGIYDIIGNGWVKLMSYAEVRLLSGLSTIVVQPTEIRLACGGSSIVLHPDRIRLEVAGTSIDLSAAAADIRGAFVKLNTF